MRRSRLRPNWAALTPICYSRRAAAPPDVAYDGAKEVNRVVRGTVGVDLMETERREIEEWAQTAPLSDAVIEWLRRLVDRNGSDSSASPTPGAYQNPELCKR